MLDSIIITFRDNKGNPIGSPTEVSQYWSDLKAVVMPPDENGKYLEIAMSIGVFISMKNDRLFQSNFSNVIRLRTTPFSVLGKLCYPINSFDNHLDDKKLNEILSLKHS